MLICNALLCTPDMLALKVKQTSIDTNSIWPVIAYKVKGAE